jgi:hypothetical protein
MPSLTYWRHRTAVSRITERIFDCFNDRFTYGILHQLISLARRQLQRMIASSKSIDNDLILKPDPVHTQHVLNIERGRDITNIILGVP